MKFNNFNLSEWSSKAPNKVFLLLLVFSLALHSCTRKPRADKYHYYQSFDELQGWVPVPPALTTEIIARSGNQCVFTDETNNYSPAFKLKFKDIDNNKPKKLKATVWCYSSNNLCDASLCVQIKNTANEYKLWAATEFKSVLKLPKTWTKIEVLADIPQEAFFAENEIAMYVWSKTKEKIYLDDFALEIYK